MEEFYIGQIFEIEYPEEAAQWCNDRADCHIELIEDGKYQIVENPKPTEEQEAERIAMLNLTGADVERGIYQAKGMDFDDILAFVMANPPQDLDVKALRIELKANHFYRGNPYVEAVGALLGFTSEQLDKFFEDGNYEHLLPPAEEEIEEDPTVKENLTVEE